MLHDIARRSNSVCCAEAKKQPKRTLAAAPSGSNADGALCHRTCCHACSSHESAIAAEVDPKDACIADLSPVSQYFEASTCQWYSGAGDEDDEDEEDENDEEEEDEPPAKRTRTAAAAHAMLSSRAPNSTGTVILQSCSSDLLICKHDEG